MRLHPWGAAFWEGPSMLLISDVHLGKVMHFRKFGAAVPREAVNENFRRLEVLVQDLKPKSICFLGDLFHSYMNREWDFFKAWVSDCPARLELVVGNHDIISPDRYEELGIRLHQQWDTGPFALTHHPRTIPSRFNIAGHIHPSVRLGGRGRQRLRLPCFYVRQHQLILPAFGTFTGTHAVSPEAGDRCFVLAGASVVPLDILTNPLSTKS